MWVIKNIFESDFGCEERMPGEPLMVWVCLEADDGRMCQFEVADTWLKIQELNEGDEWPEDLDATPDDTPVKQEEYMNNYFDAVEEMDET